MMLFFGISVQLSFEPLIAHAVCNSQHALAITSIILLLQGVSNLIVSIGQLLSVCTICNKTWLKFQKAFCFFEQ